MRAAALRTLQPRMAAAGYRWIRTDQSVLHYRRVSSWNRIIRSLPLLVAAAASACEADSATEDQIGLASEAPPLSAIFPADSIPADVSAVAVEQGRELFLPCAVCHGLDGRGNLLGPSLRDGEWVHGRGSLEEIEAVIRTGVPVPRHYPVPMVPMGGGAYDDTELRAVASYVYAISRERTATP